VIVQTNPVRLRERLEAIKLHVLEINQDSVAALYTSISQVGSATQTDAKAVLLIQKIRNHLDEIHARAEKLPHPKVMFVVGRTPQRLDGIIVVGQASYLNDLIAIAGGVNVFRDAPASYPAVSLEDVLARNPDVVLDMGEMGDSSALTQSLRESTINLWKRAASLNAVRSGQVVPIGSDIFVIPGPRIVLAADELFRIFHRGVK
jgi:iron complex transport system substrate-binding protein